jgi:hypothetical protein
MSTHGTWGPHFKLMRKAEAVLFEKLRGGRRTAPWAHLFIRTLAKEVLDQSY